MGGEGHFSVAVARSYTANSSTPDQELTATDAAPMPRHE